MSLTDAQLRKPKYDPGTWWMSPGRPTDFGVGSGSKAPPPPNNAPVGTDGGWHHPKALKARHTTPTKIVASDFDSSWTVYDKMILNPKEWGKTNELWKGGLRDWATPDSAASVWKQNGKWKHTNVHRWPLRRQPRFNRSGVEVYV